MRHPLLAALLFVLVSMSANAEPELKGTPSELKNYLDKEYLLVDIEASSTIKTKADRAILKITISIEDITLKGAIKKKSETETLIIKALVKNGIPKDSIIKAKLSAMPQSGLFSGKTKSYKIDGVLKILIEKENDLLQIASIIDNNKHVDYSGMEFEHSNKEQLQFEAIAKACEKINIKKKLYESKFGVKLNLISFSDQTKVLPQSKPAYYARRGKTAGIQGSESFDESYSAAGFAQISVKSTLKALYHLKAQEEK